MREPKFTDPDALREEIQDYLDECDGREELPAWTELAVRLGTNRAVLDRYVEDGMTGKGRRAQCGEVIAWAKTAIEAKYEKAIVNSYSKGIEAVLRQFYRGWESMAEKVRVEGGVNVKHEGEDKTAAASLTDEELLRQLAVLAEKAKLIRAKEGVTDGADGE